MDVVGLTKVLGRTDEGVKGTEVRISARAGSVAAVCEVEKLPYTMGSKPVRLLRMSGSLPFCEAARLTRALNARAVVFMMPFTSAWLRRKDQMRWESESVKVEIEKGFIPAVRGGDEATCLSLTVFKDFQLLIGAQGKGPNDGGRKRKERLVV